MEREDWEDDNDVEVVGEKRDGDDKMIVSEGPEKEDKKEGGDHEEGGEDGDQKDSKGEDDEEVEAEDEKSKPYSFQTGYSG
jgi:hypothetical protein